MKEDFWIVWNERGSFPPRHKHYSEQQAREEAQRLARGERGQVFHVLHVAGSVVCLPPPVTWIGDDSAPPIEVEVPF